MNKFNWELIYQPNTVVHCETQEQFKELGISNGMFKNIANWNKYESNTCVNFNEGKRFSFDKLCMYAGVYKILKFEECVIMNNKLLDIDFLIQKDNRTIVLDIKRMDESLRKGNFSILAQSEGGKYSIWSNYSPVMNGSKLLLRGDNKEQDNEFTYHTFNSTEEMHEYITNMNKLIDEINNPMVEIDVTKEKDYEVLGYKIEVIIRL